MSLCLNYDGTFEGFLSGVFELYKEHLDVEDFNPEGRVKNENMFIENFFIETSLESANRIERAIVKFASSEILEMLRIVFRSEEVGIEMKILAYLKKLFAGMESNYGINPATSEMLPLYTIARSVRYEVSNMLGMVRFQKMEDGVYFAEIEPKYDILPMLINHFKSRFVNEHWVIYDSKRDYGVFYDGVIVAEISIPNLKSIKPNFRSDNVTNLWRDYYNAISIKERENFKLRQQKIPSRYWKHLPELSKATNNILKPSEIAKNNAELLQISQPFLP